MMFTRYSFHEQVVAAAVMVMPRSCSCSIQSMVAVPSCTWRGRACVAQHSRRRLGARARGPAACQPPCRVAAAQERTSPILWLLPV
jgi:hypothetical protein